MFFTRVYMRQIPDFKNTVSQEVFDCRGEEFAHLLGINSMYPFDNGNPPSQQDSDYMMAAGDNPWA